MYLCNIVKPLNFKCMAIIYVSFELKGKTHSFSGESSYPSIELHEANKVDYEIVEESAFQLIKTYMEEFSLDGPINPKTVAFRYEV